MAKIIELSAYRAAHPGKAVRVRLVYNDDDNLVAACIPCNRSKGAKTPEQWKATK